jgi:RNase P subunit RPR2
MDKDQQVSFLCFNCGEKNYFDKKKYTAKEGKTKESPVKEVSIECRSCREINVVKIE